ncbi:hypothetical protein HGRIS_000838 [Hohenbuehelia grisea]|uniref:RING-type domain-containing protein n=1 Tax=Hohenbuehelia grisea TaxID=104357 RepID=A0ABR3IPW6_9AGAR
MSEEFPLPAPTTSRNRTPRSLTSRSGSRASSVHTSNSRGSSRSRSRRTTPAPAHPSERLLHHAHPLDEDMVDELDPSSDSDSGSRPAKRRRLDVEEEEEVNEQLEATQPRKDKGKGKMREEEEPELEYWDSDQVVEGPSYSGAGPSSSWHSLTNTTHRAYNLNQYDDLHPNAASSSAHEPRSHSPTSSSSLTRLLNPENVELNFPSGSGARHSDYNSAVKFSASPPPLPVHISLLSPEILSRLLPDSSTQQSPFGSPSQAESSPSSQIPPSQMTIADSPEAEPEPNLLSAYTCPICFSPPTNATLTPCGHVCCGSCLFAAVKAGIQRSANAMADQSAMCPVCRATIPGWDGKGAGVIGLKVRAAFSF